MAATAWRRHGRATPALGSKAMTRSATAARNTDRTITNLVLIVLGAHRVDITFRCFDVGAADRLHGQGGEGCGPGREFRVRLSGGHPRLPLRPVLVKLLEGDAGLWVDVRAAHDGRRDLVEPALSVDLRSKCRARSLPALSRQRARHLPSRRLAMLPAIVVPLLDDSS